MRHPHTGSLGVRKQSILKAIVTDYVHTAVPVASKTLVSRHRFGVKSATIRNEMAELLEMGYLRQPHTSAGRVPSDLGYRVYVDDLMDRAGVPDDTAQSASRRLRSYPSETDLVFEHTCRMLADLAQYTSLATRPILKDAVISQISIVRVGGRRLLAVLVLDNGRIVHQLVHIRAGSGDIDPAKATNFLQHKLGGQPLDKANEVSFAPGDLPEMRELLNVTLDFIKRELDAIEETDVHYEGASYMMQQPEFKDADRLEILLSVLEQKKPLSKMFSWAYFGPDVTVIIGSENPLRQMRDCSFVGTSYRIGGRTAGTIGVLGPTRMDYRRAVGAVEFMAKNLGDVLTSLSVA